MIKIDILTELSQRDSFREHLILNNYNVYWSGLNTIFVFEEDFSSIIDILSNREIYFTHSRWA